MILMSVCNEKSLDFINIIFQISHIRDDKIDSIHVIFRERQTTVHYNDAVFVLKSSNIHSDLL